MKKVIKQDYDIKIDSFIIIFKNDTVSSAQTILKRKTGKNKEYVYHTLFKAEEDTQGDENAI